MRRQSTFVFHHASHPWSKNKILIWMVSFLFFPLLYLAVEPILIVSD